MSDKRKLYDTLSAAGHKLPGYDDITTKELEAIQAGETNDAQKLADAEAAAAAESGSNASGLTVTNLRDNPVMVDGVRIEPKGKVTLTDEQAGNARLMAKLQHGVKTGVYSFK